VSVQGCGARPKCGENSGASRSTSRNAWSRRNAYVTTLVSLGIEYRAKEVLPPYARAIGVLCNDLQGERVTSNREISKHLSTSLSVDKGIIGMKADESCVK
jgi:hypothetical protein